MEGCAFYWCRFYLAGPEQEEATKDIGVVMGLAFCSSVKKEEAARKPLC